MARAHGLEVRLAACDWRRGVDPAQVKSALAADTAHAIKAVCVVHNETATGMMLPLDEIRAAIDDAKHPALFLVDTISSLGSLDFRMDEWKIDCVVGGSQKGLMLPTGLSFTGVSDEGDGGARTGEAAAVLFRLDADVEAPAEELHRHDSGEHLLRPARVDPVAGGRRAAECVRPTLPPGGGDAARGAGVGRQRWAAALLHQPEPILRLGHGGADAGGLQLGPGPQHGAQPVQRLARRRTGGAGRQDLPHRPSRRPERADAVGRADRGGDGAADERHPARAGAAWTRRWTICRRPDRRRLTSSPEPAPPHRSSPCCPARRGTRSWRRSPRAWARRRGPPWASRRDWPGCR